MNIKHLSCKEFGLFKDLDLTVESGVHFLSGENKYNVSSDSNGSGKSMFLDCIHYALTGKSYRGYLPDNIKEVRIELDNGLVIVRQPKVLRIYQNGKEVDIKNIQDKQEHLNSLFGNITVNFTNWKYNGFVNLSDRDKKELLESLAFQDLPNFDELTEKVRQDIVKVQQQITQVQASSTSKEDMIKSLQQDVLNLGDLSGYDEKVHSQYKMLIKQIERQIYHQESLHTIVCPKCNHSFVPGQENVSILSQDELNKLKESLQQLRTIDEHLNSILTKINYKKTLENKILKLQQESTTDQSILTELNKKAQILENAKDILSPSGIRSYITTIFLDNFNKVLEYVSYKIAYGDLQVTLSGVSKLKSGDERNKIQVLVNELPIERYSDGEKRVVDIIIQEAFRLLYPNNLDFYVFDETLTLLDESRFQSVISYYKNVVQGGGTIFVVSQDTDLGVYFDTVYKVIRKSASESIVTKNEQDVVLT
ncbi:MAG: AAA family ATPase [Nitrososphaeria archaeon]